MMPTRPLPTSRRIFLFLPLLLAAGAALAAPKPTPAPKATPAPAAASPAPAAAPSPAPSASVGGAASPAASPAAADDPVAAQQVKEGREVLITAWAPKSGAYNDAYAALKAGGGFSPAGLDTKEAITARKQLVATCVAANEELITFLNTEPAILRVELGKVNMEPTLIEQYITHFTPAPETPLVLQYRQAAKDTLQQIDGLLTLLDSTFGDWTARGASIHFKKPAEGKRYNTVITKLNKAITTQNDLNVKLNATLAPAPDAAAAAAGSPTPAGALATPAPASPSPASSPAKGSGKP